MKTLIILALLSVTTMKPDTTSLSDAEREFAINYLTETKNDLSSSVLNLTAEQLTFKPEPNKWSIAECLEHITIAEIGLWQMSQSALKEPAAPERRKEITVADKDVIQRLTNRRGKANSPEFLKPIGQFPTSDAAVVAFTTQRDNTIQYISNTTDDLRNHFGAHPVTGTIDAYQVILLMAAHGKRHTLQIEEVKANVNFPK